MQRAVNVVIQLPYIKIVTDMKEDTVESITGKMDVVLTVILNTMRQVRTVIINTKLIYVIFVLSLNSHFLQYLIQTVGCLVEVGVSI